MGRWGRILTTVAGIALVVLCIGALVHFVNNDTKTIPASEFSVGAIDETTGKYKADEQSVYTEKMFKCQGLRVELDFEATCTYDVFYYDTDGRLLDKKLGLSDIYDEDFPLAQYARIVIHPDVESMIDEDEDADEWTVGVFGARKIAKMLKITVDKEQNDGYDYTNLYVEAEAQQGKTFDKTGSTSDTLVLEDDVNMKVSNEIAITGEYKYYDIYVKEAGFGAYAISAVAVTEDNTILVREAFNMNDLAAGEWCKMTIKVPKHESDMYLAVRMPKNSECYIFGYNSK